MASRVMSCSHYAFFKVRYTLAFQTPHDPLRMSFDLNYLTKISQHAEIKIYHETIMLYRLMPKSQSHKLIYDFFFVFVSMPTRHRHIVHHIIATVVNFFPVGFLRGFVVCLFVLVYKIFTPQSLIVDQFR